MQYGLGQILTIFSYYKRSLTALFGNKPANMIHLYPKDLFIIFFLSFSVLDTCKNSSSRI